jgi:hypothetical protein
MNHRPQLIPTRRAIPDLQRWAIWRFTRHRSELLRHGDTAFGGLTPAEHENLYTAKAAAA